MRKFIIGVFIFFSSFSVYGQVSIGYDFKKIKEEDSTGTLEIDPSGKGFVYIYDNKNLSTVFFYFLNIQKICYATSVKPYTRVSKRYWIDGLNESKDWVKVKSKYWVMDLKNNTTVECVQDKDSNKKTIFIFVPKFN